MQANHNLVYGYLPPQATEPEAAVLGAIMLERDKLEEVLELIPDEQCFYLDAHQKIFAAIKALFAAGSVIDLITVVEQLKRQAELEIVGGAHAVMKLTMNVVSSAHILDHARIILEKFMKREQIRIGGQMMAEGYDDTVDVFDSMDDSQNELFHLTTVGIKKDFQPITKSMTPTVMAIHQQREQKVEFTGVPTPFSNLNALTGGWQRKHLIVAAARPGVGKTAFSLCCALACAQDPVYGGAVAIFNLEMDADQLNKRLLANVSGVHMDHIMKPWKLTDEELVKMDAAAEKISRLPIFIDDTAGLGLTELRAKGRRLKKKHDVKLIIVDYLQLMSGDMGRAGGNREQEISKISRETKKLAKDLDVPILDLSQLNRSVDTRADNEPQLSDLRESGAIEQDADIVLLMSKPSKKTLKEKPHLSGKVILTVAKNRHGATDEFVYNCNNDIQRWTEPDIERFGSFVRMQDAKIPPLPQSGPVPDSHPMGGSGPHDDLPF